MFDGLQFFSMILRELVAVKLNVIARVVLLILLKVLGTYLLSNSLKYNNAVRSTSYNCPTLPLCVLS